MMKIKVYKENYTITLYILRSNICIISSKDILLLKINLLEKSRYIGQFGELAAKYGVHKVTIIEIAYGYSWRSVSKDYNIDYNNKLHNRFSENDVHIICSIFQKNKLDNKTFQESFIEILSVLGLERNSANRQRIQKIYNRDPGYFKRISDQYVW